jgi:hypothetical protein
VIALLLVLAGTVGWIVGRVTGFAEGRIAGRAELLRELRPARARLAAAVREAREDLR